MLNSRKDEYICVRGNCDTEVDQMVLDFPILAEYGMLLLGDETVFMTHGHHHGEKNPPPLKAGDILLCGHTHVPACTAHEGFLYMNPGSVAIPKQGSRHSYMTWENGEFYWKDVTNGEIWHCRQDGEIKL